MTLVEALRKAEREHWRTLKYLPVTNIKAALADPPLGLGASTPLAAIDEARLTTWRKDLLDAGNKPGTVNRKLALVSKVLTLAVRWKVIAAKPHIPLLREAPSRIRVLTAAEEAEALRLAAGVDVQAGRLFAFLCDTGMRLGEALKLRVRDVNRQSRAAYLVDTKSGKNRVVPLVDRAWRVVEARLKTGLKAEDRVFPYEDRHEVDRLWAKVREQMGLAGDREFVVHALRHTCGTRLWERTGDVYLVREWLGHENIETTLKYCHASPTKLFHLRTLLDGVGSS